MTEKEKAKAYDEAIGRAKKLYSNGIAEEIFPELKESEDEKIRKEIISILRNAYWTSNKNRFNELVTWIEKQRDKDKLIQELGEYKVKYTQEVLEKYVNSMSNKDDERLRKTAIAFLKDFAEQGYENAVECIAWLEKQGKKPTDKAKPRFNVGDWVVNKFGDSWHIDSFDKKNYQISDGKGNYNYFPILKQDEMHIWTIQDSKDGDVLALSWLEDKNLWEKIIIFKKYHSKGVKGLCSMPCVEGYGSTFKNGEMIFTKISPYYSKTWTCNLHSATKEQRSLFFQKMKEAGYKWNDETKTLEKLVEHRFDPKTLKPFDKIIARVDEHGIWCCEWFSFIDSFIEENIILIKGCGAYYKYCIPYNDETKHLVGTTDEAPEFYKYWEE